jgi:tRNA A37 N6-isopentenylltransferase MiaA
MDFPCWVDLTDGGAVKCGGTNIFSEALLFEPSGAKRSRNCEHGRLESQNEQGEDDMHADLIQDKPKTKAL